MLSSVLFTKSDIVLVQLLLVLSLQQVALIVNSFFSLFHFLFYSIRVESAGLNSSNAVKNVLFHSFCVPMLYASQLWCNFRKSCMQRLHVAYDFRCRALYNQPLRASVSSHQVQYNISTFEMLLWKNINMYLFLERCRKSNNIGNMLWCSQDCFYSYLFSEHCNRVLLCEWVIKLYSVCLIDGVSCHNAFAF